MMESQSLISVVIPTYQRDQILVDTINYLLALEVAPNEILVVDQDPSHGPAVHSRLLALEAAGSIQWLRLLQPSIPHAMNTGLRQARGGLVLFLDDDIIPAPGLVTEHLRAHESHAPDLVAGKVDQPWGPTALQREWEESEGTGVGEYRWVLEFMGGNFSVKRSRALELGGFDENFVGAAYRYEAEFAGRLCAAGGSIIFAPKARVEHLKATEGGTRFGGDHRRTIRPHHSVGEYYFLLTGKAVCRRWRRVAWRPLKAISTRFHLTHPWWIPLALVAEATGFVWAVALRMRGPKYASVPTPMGAPLK